MPSSSGGGVLANQLLAALSPADLSLLDAELERVPLACQDLLQGWEQSLTHLWFPSSGVASMVSRMADGTSVEVATIGREGVVGISAVLGASRLAQSVFVQIPGEGVRLPVERYVALADRLPVLGRPMLRYAATLVTYIRGEITILDRHRLEEAACECYDIITGEFRHLFGRGEGA